MSWLARSIADSLRIDDGEDAEQDDDAEPNDAKPNDANKPIPPHSPSEQSGEQEDGDDRTGRGVREDISELTETLTRQFWGVASFLAPPPPPPPPPLPQSRHRVDRLGSERFDSDRQAAGPAGISGAHEEVICVFRNASYHRSSNQVESEIWNMGSSFLPYQQEVPVVDAVGITEEVLAFARNIAHHPETWLDFPIEEEDDIDELEMTDALYSHALAVQHLAPRLAALRIELCPAHMSEGYFWKVYFVLLHSRLSKHDAELLSTPQIVAARAMWIRELQKKTKAETDWSGRGKENSSTWQVSYDETAFDDSPRNMPPHSSTSESPTYDTNSEFVAEKHPVVSTDMQIVDKSVIEEEPVKKPETFVPRTSFKVPVQCYDDEDDDDWLKDDSELEGYNATAILIGDEEDVSFSDLEDDGDCTVPLKSKDSSTV